MRYNVRIVSTYPPRRCGIGTFSRDLSNALTHFVADVTSVRVAAIDKSRDVYSSPVDLIIDQYSPSSWRTAAGIILDGARDTPHPTVVLLQHEYGLDPDDAGNDGQGCNYVDVAKALHEGGLIVVAYLHTVLSHPNDHQRHVLQALARYSDAVFVTTESAIGILSSAIYGIERQKVKHIDHGIRMQNPSQHDRLAIKDAYGIEDQLLVTTLGMRSPNKGIHYGIRAYARFIAESCTDEQRRHITYLIGGPYHPEFVRAENGTLYQEYCTKVLHSLEKTGMRWCEIDQLGDGRFADHDVVFLDRFLDENMLVELYAATNVMVLPYLNTDQISSGILADTLGAGRVAIATKFMYAVELLDPGTCVQRGVIIGPQARGVLVDPGEPSVEQIARALDYLVFNKQERLAMEKRAQERGHQMRWDNTAWELLQYVEFLREQKERVTGRGITFAREKPSVLAEMNSALPTPK